MAYDFLSSHSVHALGMVKACKVQVHLEHAMRLMHASFVYFERLLVETLLFASLLATQHRKHCNILISDLILQG